MAEAMNRPASSMIPCTVTGSAWVKGSSRLISSRSHRWVRTKAMSSSGGT